jgi:hypothetical protein
MGVERDDGLPGEIILIKEGIYDHRHFIPPDRVAYENNVIVCPGL